MEIKLKNGVLKVDFAKGEVTSLIINGRERLASTCPLFEVKLRNKAAEITTCSVYDAKTYVETENGAVYSGFENADISVCVSLKDECGEAAWYISVKPNTDDVFVECVDFPKINLPILADNNKNGNGGKILFPYNEGVLVSDIEFREQSWFPHRDAEYPSEGSFSVFPNMLCSQMLAYLWDDAGLYVGAHDQNRGVKEIDFFKELDGITIRFRLYCGTDFGQEFSTDYPIVFAVTDQKWESAAERYRTWFESALPEKVKKINENGDVPNWYEDSPLVVSYPVRGEYDTDDMAPNKLYPYTNALPLLQEIRALTDSRLLVLLMHWEGTAPWAPPYVWPPFGGVENFNTFKNELHKKGDLFGVYCSGFGYTIQSNLVKEYNMQNEYNQKQLWRGMCAGPDGKVLISNICTAQRSGYDICPASEVGKQLLKQAYEPLLKTDIDYVQILDQNHGGGQYFCYSREHGHAPGPGAWMTENMQQTLTEWNGMAEKTLLGCESAASEPFIGNLLFSDNRFELNYRLGVPVPLYNYIYHEYVRNFMGNQVCCPFAPEEDTLRYRLAYSFSIGDCMTVVLTQNGELMSHWGKRGLTVPQNKEKVFKLIANLSKFYKEQAKPYLYNGRMTASPIVECESQAFSIGENGEKVTLPSVRWSAWESADGKKAVVLVNPNTLEQRCFVEGKEVTIPALDAVLMKF